jgi:hypothetical protein
MTISILSRPVVKLVRLYGPSSEVFKNSIQLRRNYGTQHTYSLKKYYTAGEKLVIGQKNELRHAIKQAIKGEPKRLLRDINGDRFDALGNKEVGNRITKVIKKTQDQSIIGVLQQALEWTKGNYTNRWWF